MNFSSNDTFIQLIFPKTGFIQKNHMWDNQYSPCLCESVVGRRPATPSHVYLTSAFWISKKTSCSATQNRKERTMAKRKQRQKEKEWDGRKGHDSAEDCVCARRSWFDGSECGGSGQNSDAPPSWGSSHSEDPEICSRCWSAPLFFEESPPLKMTDSLADGPDWHLPDLESVFVSLFSTVDEWSGSSIDELHWFNSWG